MPAELWRPLRHPAASSSCPVTKGRRLPPGLPFGGTAFGEGRVRVVLVGAKAGARITVDPVRRDGWYGKKSLWFAEPSYQGPVLLRGTRLDKPGEVAFGEEPRSLAVQIPPGPGVNNSGGYRHWPGSTWVRSPGCYGLQADGLNFSVSIVVEVRAPGG
ncbi:hypothetical protein [Nonomuraea typhae]|uniref:hypothetical protein n=1 Tax=Nonomuraea typhae TaxID=2603600 RepID=UPI0012FBA023|nr:hypothetical protein [Nonomuraea typhae]